MNTQRALHFQQAEFFLLYNLVVEELRLLRRTKRIAPSVARDVCGATTIITRFFRSFLVKVFPHPMRVFKQLNRLQFSVTFDESTQKILQGARDSETFRILQTPEVEELGLLRLNMRGLTLTISGVRTRRNRWSSVQTWSPVELGIGRFCVAAKVAIALKKRLDKVIAEAAMTTVAPVIQRPNVAQEQLDAVLMAAAEAGTL